MVTKIMYISITNSLKIQIYIYILSIFINADVIQHDLLNNDNLYKFKILLETLSSSMLKQVSW